MRRLDAVLPSVYMWLEGEGQQGRMTESEAQTTLLDTTQENMISSSLFCVFVALGSVWCEKRKEIH